ncbi:MAG TPA: hypothetical protein VF808_09065 [Ktedonobacterales bacterium]
MFDPRSPYQRRMWHYESDRPLSIAQLVAAGSLDTWTAALLWLLVERHQSFLVSGPTDPTPGVGKTTTMNALLGFLPAGSTVVYTMGMYEDFGFTAEVDPATTCVIANEVSDHLRIYMWGRTARTLLRLPQDGFAVASSCHADAIDDVMAMLVSDMRLDAADLRRLGVIVNIGLVGDVWPQRRRFLTTHFIAPEGGDDEPWGVRLLQLAAWCEDRDDFTHAESAALAQVAAAIGMEPEDMTAALRARQERLAPIVQGRGASIRATRQVVDRLAAEERGEPEEHRASEPDEEAE